jgi:hypothetical protein
MIRVVDVEADIAVDNETYHYGPDLVVAAGVEHLAKLLEGETTDTFAYMQFGYNLNNAEGYETDLRNPYPGSRTATTVTVHSTTPMTYQWQATFGPYGGNQGFGEIGLFTTTTNGTGVMLCRKPFPFPGFTLYAGQIATVRIRITMKRTRILTVPGMYATIQEAVDASSPYDEIQIDAARQYAETVIVDVEGLNIHMIGDITSSSYGVGFESSDVHSFDVTANNVTIGSIRFQNKSASTPDGYAAINVQGNNCSILDCIINTCGCIGVCINGGTACVIDGLDIDAVHLGIIDSDYYDQVTIRDVTINDDDIGGIRLTYANMGAVILLENVTLQSNANVSGAGVLIAEDSFTTTLNNVDVNSRGNGPGFDLSHGPGYMGWQLTLNGCKAWNVWNGYGMNIVDNNGIGPYPIIDIEDCNIYYSGIYYTDVGIYVSANAGTLTVNNTIVDTCGLIGMQVVGGLDVTLTASQFNNTMYSTGADLNYTNTLTATGCVFSTNAQIGMSSTNMVGTLTLSSCDYSANGTFGLNITSSSGGTIQNCEFLTNVVQLQINGNGIAVTQNNFLSVTTASADSASDTFDYNYWVDWDGFTYPYVVPGSGGCVDNNPQASPY